MSAGWGSACAALGLLATRRQPTHCYLSPQLTASNHVSNVTVNYNVTVERMNRMRGLWVSAVPPVLPPNATLALAAHVLVDSAVEVAFL